MATLTETAYFVKRFLAGFFFLISLFVVGKTVLNYYKAYQLAHRPPTPPPYTLAFGRLPKVKLPPDNRKTTRYTIGTLDGKIPSFPPIGTVYFIPPHPGFTFFTKERAYNFAKKFGFQGEPTIVSSEEYQWTDPELPGRIFTLNIFTNNFVLEYNFATDSAVLKSRPPQKREAETFASRFLVNKNIMPKDLEKGDIRSKYLFFDGKNFKRTTLYSEANLVRVDLFRQNINKMPVVTEKYNQGLVSFLISGAEKKKKILQLEYTFWPVDLENSGTYPLKTGEEAFSELKAGGGTVVLGEEQEEAVIRNIYLAYLDTKAHQSFLQPIFVFEGDKNFVAYVPAIKEEWVE